MATINCFKGMHGSDLRRFDLNPSSTLNVVRAALETSGFVPHDNPSEHVEYRFVAMKAMHTNLKNSLIERGAESSVPLAAVLGGNNNANLILANELATSHPDLLGIGTDWFESTDQKLQVGIRLNDTDGPALATNRNLEAFTPVQLANVVPASTAEQVQGTYGNVCVCLNGSIVEFVVNAFGDVGYQYVIAADAGEPIVPETNPGELFTYWGNTGGRMSTSVQRRYSTDANTIAVVGTSQMGIGAGKVASYQRLTIKSRPLTYYEQGGKSFGLQSKAASAIADEAVQVTKTVTEAATSIANVFGSIFSTVAKAESQIKPQVQMSAMAAVEPGTIALGGVSAQSWGDPIQNMEFGAWSEVVIWFFVFSGQTDANRTVGALNPGGITVM